MPTPRSQQHRHRFQQNSVPGAVPAARLAAATPPGEETVADSTDGAAAGTFTLDSEVSRLLAKPFTQKDNPGADGVTVLHGYSKSANVNQISTRVLRS